MANRDLLKEAIADAKAVKEVAIANAKAALEEAFTPKLQSMLSEKIHKLDEEGISEDELSEADKVNKELEETKEMEAEGKKELAKEEIQEEELEEDLNLEEILAELELEEETNEPHGNIGHNQEEGEALGFEEGEDYMEEAKGDTEGDDMEIDLENMSEDELQGFIEDVIEKMIEDGELVPGPNADESEAEEAEDTDDGTEGDADVDIEVDDIDLEEGKDPVGEGMLDFLKKKKKEAPKPKKPTEKILGVDFDGNYIYGEGKELKEAKLVIKHLQSELNEVNLLNSKLLYTNKIFKAKNLTENQKIKVLKAFDKAETVNEAKVIFESLNENLVSKKTKSSIKESMGFASKSAGVAPKRPLTEQVIEEDAMVSRFKKLAGIN
jgi:hypothetical protein